MINPPTSIVLPHTLDTSGKRTPNGEREWTFNDIVGRAFANELALYDGVATKRFDDPTGKTDVSLTTRTNNANNWGANYFISFHHNANTGQWGNWTGVETFVYTSASKMSMALAQAIHPALVAAYGLRDRGIKKGNLHMVRETKMPAILIEGGFMDSTIDIKKLRDVTVLQNAGKLIAQALARHLKLKKSQPAAPVINELDQRAIQLVRKAVAKGVFTSPHDKVNEYTAAQLYEYMVILGERIMK